MGLNGYWLKQVTDTEVDGEKVKGRREQVWAIGPGAMYSFSKMITWLQMPILSKMLKTAQKVRDYKFAMFIILSHKKAFYINKYKRLLSILVYEKIEVIKPEPSF